MSGRDTFFGPLPTTGVWTAAGLTRLQFLTILAAAVLVYALWQGFLGPETREFERITVSYAVIPVGVALALGPG